ncbi:hypothetical protein [Mycobacterium sp. NAZ190054]|uniref:hypothetical protein n=1 Tax=Mycobacterium sp. NAZ190054 TaxID=1747766 RepID=UPI0007919F36|nr:hypothetical protein [Mycobacterium sp. NAZ190054]KWX67241.1 hypothetical protein ASJ79_22395 [Mycobacterium sp. NAZ190054]
MSDGRRRRKAKQARRDARRTTDRERDPAQETPLVDEVRGALTGHPLELLGIVGVIIEATIPLAWLGPGEQRETPDLAGLVDGFIGVPNLETSALLAALAELLDDAELRARCRRELGTRPDALPRWLTELAGVEVYRAARLTHALGDGDEVLVGARLAGGGELTCVAVIDHTAQGAVRDAFVVPDPIDDVIRVAAERITDPDAGFVDMSLGDARAWLERGLNQPIVMEPSDSWPACRPVLRWLTRRIG